MSITSFCGFVLSFQEHDVRFLSLEVCLFVCLLLTHTNLFSPSSLCWHGQRTRTERARVLPRDGRSPRNSTAAVRGASAEHSPLHRRASHQPRSQVAQCVPRVKVWSSLLRVMATLPATPQPPPLDPRLCAFPCVSHHSHLSKRRARWSSAAACRPRIWRRITTSAGAECISEPRRHDRNQPEQAPITCHCQHDLHAWLHA